MENLKLINFIVPFIVLVLIVVLFNFLLIETSNKAALKRFILMITASAFLLNFAWEVIQVPLYKGAGDDLREIAFCALASAADTLMVLLLYFCLALIYRKPFWAQHLTAPRILLVMLIGGIGAIGVEIFHLSSGNWAYADSMPIIPVVNAGLSPVLQFMILPGLIYYVSFQILSKLETQFN